MVENFFYVDGIYKEDELRRILEKKDSAKIAKLRCPIKRRIVMRASNHSGKAIVLEELEIPEEMERRDEKFYKSSGVTCQRIPEELRIGYYVVNQKDQWQWGQFAQMLPAKDFEFLIGKAIEHGFIRQAP